jgi:hypothetical protein
MTFVHFLIATPLYDLIAIHIMGVYRDHRAGHRLRIMLPDLVYRLPALPPGISSDLSIPAIGVGTASASALTCLLTLATWWFSGIVVATSAVICGVVVEAIYVGIVVRPVLKTS